MRPRCKNTDSDVTFSDNYRGITLGPDISKVFENGLDGDGYRTSLLRLLYTSLLRPTVIMLYLRLECLSKTSVALATLRYSVHLTYPRLLIR